MTNQEFCYWLQGYFEISKIAALTKEKIVLINGSLNKVNEPLGEFTQWLTKVNAFFSDQQYKQEFLDLFLQEIQSELNGLFLHVIDNNHS